MKRAIGCLVAVATAAVIACEVKIKEDSIVLPTYAPGGYDKTPLFYTGRVYQGAQGRVYPYPMQDVLHDEKIDETYKYLTMENDWFHVGMLPEHGGHLLNFTDKESGFETFYRQHVIKPALIGMLGAWISGGVEWNFPHHHRATTAMPIDWRFTANKDGTKTIWFGETELRRRLKWTIGLSLLPDRAVLRADNVFMNRQPWIESMIYWANVSVHCGDDYQIQFPPSMHLGFDHHKNYWTSYPIGPRKEELELLPSQRSKYANDISGTMDLSWWKNFTIESRSIFGMDPDNAFMAGYDHKKNMGTAHVSNRHITVGKKFFLWGNFPEAHVWDTVLTDNDGPYLELMVGCWSDNQPDYSWIAPYETRKVSQYWFPVKGIGGVKNVTIDGAVNVDRVKPDELLVGFHSTRVLKGCTVRVRRNSGNPGKSGDSGKSGNSGVVFTESGIAIDPNTPWCKTVKVEPGVADQAFTAEIVDANGKVFLAYTPVPPQGKVELPPKVENPKEPKEYTSAELVYEVGLRLDQFQNGILDPEPYYKRALEIDPDYTKANLAMGVRLAKNGSYAEAKPYLERAVARATQNHTRALDAAPEYYLALVERGLGNLKRAEDLFWRCTWRLTHKKESYVEIARIAALRGDWEEALARIDDALALGQDEAKLWTMKGIFLRKLYGTATSEASKNIQRAGYSAWDIEGILNTAVAYDPLEYWAVVERELGRAASPLAAAKALAAAEKNRGLKAQQLLECISDYWGIGCYDEVIALCDAALAKAAAEKPYRTEGPRLPLADTIAACDSYKNALFGYFKGAAQLKMANVANVKMLPMTNSNAQLEIGNIGTGNNSILATFSAAASMPTDYCFPNRLEEEEVLKIAAKAAPELANTWYYLGCCEWNHDRKDAGLADWKKCVALCETTNHQPLTPNHSSYALALRCIGFALSHPGTYFTNTGVPSGIPSKEAYEYYLKSLEADPTNFRTLDEAGKLAEKLNIPAPKRLALMEKYRSTVYKYDACVLRLAYIYNTVGRYAEAHEILTTRRFHVWEGADGLLAPFVESCIGLGKAAMAKGDYKTAFTYFEESTTYPANLQAGRPGDAGTEPKSRYFMAQCKKALGDEAGYKAELENSLKGWIHAGEMDYWRVKALRELGRDAECAPLIAELKAAIKELETPAPVVINAYAKFAGDNSAMERAAKAREKASELRALLAELEAAHDATGNAISLAGKWDFGLGCVSNCTDTITLPSTTDIAKKGDGRIGGVEVEKIDVKRDDASVKNRLTRHLTRRFPYVGKATYERDIEIPSAWAGRRVEIFLERTKILDAYLDGKFFAYSDTLAAPARLTLPAGMKPGRHRLRLVVDNSWKKLLVTGHQVSEDTQTNWNGVMGRMEMRAYGALSIVQVKAFPSAAEGKVTAKVVFRNEGARAKEARVEVGASVVQGQQAYNSKVEKRAFPYVVPCGVSTGEFTVVLGPDAPKWSEFNPVLHRLTVKAGEASATVKFGLRDFRTKGTQFTLNGRPMFLRGRHDACVWPLTGAAPMEVEPWRKYFATLKEYGLNHVRFHSWCPPEAAFEAADEAGFIMLPEFGVFGGNFAGDAKLRAYCLAESKRIIDAYGNHPSFAMFTLGNECRGGRKERAEIIRALRTYDPRPLYAIATNGDWNAPQLCEEDDFWATFRSCDGAEGNARGSYAHCNAPLGAVQLPGGGTMRDFSSAVRHSPIPVIGHETGQFQAYPDYSEIPKYTGVLKPINLEIFKARLEKAGLGKYADDFCFASGRLMAINYREEMEEAFRTPGFGGFQLLDLQDFPGQGTALVGVLNAFMETKGFITPERWRMSCSPTVLLARFPRYTYVSGEKFVADVQIAHYGQEDVLTGDLEWSIEPIGRTGIPPKRRKVVASGKTGIPPVRVGEVKTVGRIEVALPRLESQKHPARARWFELCLSFADGKVKNSYPIWVYPEDDGGALDGVEIVRDLESADKALAEGRTALCILDKAKAPKNSVPGFFTTDFWNWEMFNGPARKRKVIAPGTLGLLVKRDHPALAGFPTSFHSDYQWRELIFNGVNVVLDGDKDADVIVRGIDNITRNQNLGVIWEKRRGKGHVLYCSIDLEAAKDLPEARALRRSLLEYMRSDLRAASLRSNADERPLFTAAVFDKIAP